MPEVQQVKRLILSQFQQFRLCDFDFTDPSSGLPMKQVCLTGPNGCGKSTILAQLYHAIDPTILPIAVDEEREANALILVQYALGAQSIFLARNGIALGAAGSKFSWFSDDIINAPGWDQFVENGMGFHEFDDQFADYAVNQDDSIVAPDATSAWLSPEMDLIDSHPADDLREMVDSISNERSQRFNDFLKHPDNRNETVAAVEELFEDEFPDPLVEIALAWKPLLAPANIRFSRANPVSLVSSRTGERIPFSALSPGVRRYLLRTGHLRLLGESDLGAHSFFVIDQPESGLSEALSASLLDDCLAQAHGEAAQTFVATLSEAVTSKFSAHERFELQFDETQGVSIVQSLPVEPEPTGQPAEKEEPTTHLPKSNAIKLARLKRDIRETEDQDELADLIDELMSIRER